MKTIVRPPVSARTRYRCARCGSACYQPLMDRDGQGRLRATAWLRCSGCRDVFASVRAWCTGGTDDTPTAP